MKDTIFWLGLTPVTIFLEFWIVPSSVMFHFTAMLLLVALFLFRARIVFGLGVCMMGFLLSVTSITSMSVLLGWLGSWGVLAGILFVIAGKKHIWPLPLGIVLFRITHYLFSPVPILGILTRADIWAGLVLNVVLAAALGLWLRQQIRIST